MWKPTTEFTNGTNLSKNMNVSTGIFPGNQVGKEGAPKFKPFTWKVPKPHLPGLGEAEKILLVMNRSPRK